MSPHTERFGPYTVELTSRDKVLFPDSGITKGDLIDHYRRVAPYMLPHIERRPLTLQRFPDGIDADGFYQKATPDYFPRWVGRASVSLEGGGRQSQVTADNEATLVYLAQQATITLHMWTSRAPRWSRPDRLVFDLDPGESTAFDTIRETARALRARLGSVGLAAFAMLTGSRGVHVWVPIRRGPDFDTVRAFARSMARAVIAEAPDDLTGEIRKDARAGRLFVDVARNAKGQTVVAPYSLRPRPGAPVATPITWDEQAEVDTSATYTLTSLPMRLDQVGDPWKGMGRRAANLSVARERWERARG